MEPTIGVKSYGSGNVLAAYSYLVLYNWQLSINCNTGKFQNVGIHFCLANLPDLACSGALTGSNGSIQQIEGDKKC